MGLLIPGILFGLTVAAALSLTWAIEARVSAWQERRAEARADELWREWVSRDLRP